MTIKIDEKITGYEVVKEEPKRAESNVVHMHEKLERPEVLVGSTYKIKTPPPRAAPPPPPHHHITDPPPPPQERRAPLELSITPKNWALSGGVGPRPRVIRAVSRRGGAARGVPGERG